MSINFVRAQCNYTVVQVPIRNHSEQKVIVEPGLKLGTIFQPEITSNYCAKITNIRAAHLTMEADTEPKVVEDMFQLCNEFRGCFTFDLKELGCKTKHVVNIDVLG